MSYFVDPEVYEQYREAVLEMSNSVQVNLPEHLPPEQRKPCRSDAEIAEALGLDEATVREIRCVAEREYYPVTRAQRRLWILDQLEENQIAYNLPFNYVYQGVLNQEALKRTVAALVERHESMRTTFATVSGEPVHRHLITNRSCQ